MASTTDKFTDIANAIKVKTALTNSNQSSLMTDDRYKIVANDFAEKIMSIDRLRPMTLYPNGLDNGYYGNQAAIIAATYHFARNTGLDSFVYNSASGLFGGTNPRVRDTSSSLTDSSRPTTSGFARIDCSTYIGLVLRGITYANSPYAKHPYDASEDANNRWVPSTEIGGMYGSNGWEFNMIDSQPVGVYNNIGIDGRSTLRTAADFGEFFYKYGMVLYDSMIDAPLTAESAKELAKSFQPGDLIFWAKASADEVQQRRFRSISHIAIVSERTDRYYHATSGSSVVLYSAFTDAYEEVALVCRPDYRPNKITGEIPVGVNLLRYPWSYGSSTVYEENGMKFSVNKDKIGVIHLSGTNTDAFSVNIKGHSNNDNSYIKLTPGTYTLSGMSGTGVKALGLALQLRNADGSDFDPVIRCYDGNNPTFTLTKITNVKVQLYIGANGGDGYTLDCDITPTLKRTS